MTIFSNQYLNKEQMSINAEWILSYLLGKGWSKQAICGVLGNMESESTINAGLWESRNYGNLKNGYGLVQWTPASKYINWCNSVGIPHASMESNMKRLLYEVDNNIQWINSLDPKGRSFRQFTQSTDSPYDLAMVFIKAYERPKNPNQSNRGTQAEYWYNTLTGEGSPIFEGNIVDYYLNLDPSHYLSSEYGMRFHPIENVWKMHAGDDIAKSGGSDPKTPVPSDSKIIFAGNSNSTAGNWVVYNPIGSQYMIGIFHFNTVTVKKGDIIGAGTIVGTMGVSGGVTGRHWHIEVRDLNTSNYWGATHYPPREILFNIGGSGGSGSLPDLATNNLIHLYLTGAVNNWLNF